MATRSLSEAVKKRVAARQGWRCSGCREMLPSTYQIDHTVALVDGGADDPSNCTAMCPNCHADKTQREVVARIKRASDSGRARRYEEREDIRVGDKYRCAECGVLRALNAGHAYCPAIEDPMHRSRAVASSLARFAFAGNRGGGAV